MKTKPIILAVCLLASSSFAAIINGNFESGLDGWTIFAEGGEYLRSKEPEGWDVFTEYPYPLTENPVYVETWSILDGGGDGKYLQLLIHGADNRTWGGPDGKEWSFQTQHHWAGVYQDIDLVAGQTISGWARFSTDEGIEVVERLDYGAVIINGAIIWDANVVDAHALPGWVVPWELWQFTASSPGTYRLQFEIHQDVQTPSFLGILSVSVSTVPDGGSSLTLLGMAFGLIMLGRVKR